jgi:hypothetical protein
MLNSNTCVVCNDSISDPVCRSCYIKQISILLNDLEMHSMVKEVILNKIKDKFPGEVINDTKCILCKQENVALCRYCFSEILVKILRELNFTENSIKNFGYNQMYEENSLERESRIKFEIINR